jgi:Activator of Hsp90 ATPase homolog 1-like protein
MSTISTVPGIESLTLIVSKEIQVQASVEDTFAALLEQLGPGNTTPEGVSMPMKLEPWPGGRWWRDLGDNNGHFWGHVQAIKRPTLIEFSGPLFMSYAAVSNVQYRLSESDGGTLITFHHKAMGAIQDDHREGVNRGWTHILEGIRQRAEASSR